MFLFGLRAELRMQASSQGSSQLIADADSPGVSRRRAGHPILVYKRRSRTLLGDRRRDDGIQCEVLVHAGGDASFVAR